jgi:transcriptional regulator with XRE-family HTH domain
MSTQPNMPQSYPDQLDPLVRVVRDKRKQLRWSQDKLAQAAGISRRALLMLENGGDCNLSTLRRLHTCLDIEMQATSAQAPTLDDMNAQNAKERFGAAI